MERLLETRDGIFDWHTITIGQHRRSKWREMTGYGGGTDVETKMCVYKSKKLAVLFVQAIFPIKKNRN